MAKTDNLDFGALFQPITKMNESAASATPGTNNASEQVVAAPSVVPVQAEHMEESSTAKTNLFINVRILARLNAYLKRTDKKKTSVVNRALEEYLDKYDR